MLNKSDASEKSEWQSMRARCLQNVELSRNQRRRSQQRLKEKRENGLEKRVGAVFWYDAVDLRLLSLILNLQLILDSRILL